MHLRTRSVPICAFLFLMAVTESPAAGTGCPSPYGTGFGPFTGYNPAFTTDTTALVFAYPIPADSYVHLFRLDLASLQLTRLTHDPVCGGQPDVDPITGDVSFIRVAMESGQTNGVFQLHDGVESLRLQAKSAPGFAATGPASTAVVEQVFGKPDGTARFTIRTKATTTEFYPPEFAPSPVAFLNPHTLLYAGTPLQPQQVGPRLMTCDIVSNTSRPWEPATNLGEVWSPAISPDLSHLAFIRLQKLHRELVIWDVSPTAQPSLLLTGGKHQNLNNPRFSPDASNLVLWTSVGNNDFESFLILDAQTGEITITLDKDLLDSLVEQTLSP